MATVKTRKMSSSTSACTYHVFLSFIGEQTRKTFTDHLYTALEQAGLRPFGDDKELQRGENVRSELQKTIQQSRVCIIVLSKDYIASGWCLDELVVILEYKKRTPRRVILPVFYNLGPSQVRKLTGSIGEAFAKLEEQFDVETDEGKKKWTDKVKGWREALIEVANLGGMVLHNQADEHKSKFIEKIVKVINDRVSRPVPSINPFLIGIQSRARNINMWLQDGSTNVGVMAICGMGGTGKTTIARFVYNRNFQRFESSSFLANVRKISSQPNGLIRLQRRFLWDIQKMKRENIYCVDEGILNIKDAVHCKRVLLVLDDVDAVEQLNAIMEMRDWFYPGSKIIVTTRHNNLPRHCELNMVHKVQILDDDEALELFSWHAFGQEHPIDGYAEHSERAAHLCGGLPLALQVLGSSLSGKSLDVWESAVQKLKGIPGGRIIEKLKISFDCLQDDHDKNLFLHIACFFVGKDKDRVVEILDECDFYTAVGLQNLIDRCFLTIDESNKLTMHQLLQDLGRYIVSQEAPEKPGKRSRLWHHKDSFDVLRHKTGTETVKGIILDMHLVKEHKSAEAFSSEEFLDTFSGGYSRLRQCFGFFSLCPLGNPVRTAKVEFEIDAFSKMHNLRLLQLNCVQLNGCFGEFPKRLTWLCWHGIPLKSIPSDFPLESLVTLDMRYGNLEQVWKENKFLRLLKTLDLSHSHRLIKTPNFTGLPNLERLVLKDCVSLVEIDESITNLDGLAFLNLKDCKKLRKLPKNFPMLKALETLIISGCWCLDVLSTELRKMKFLKVLHADGIPTNQLVSTNKEAKLWHDFIRPWVLKPRKSPEPSWASLPSSLMSLSLVNCNLSNEDIPKDLTNLGALQNLNLSENPICSLPVCIKGLTRLQTLYLQKCRTLTSVLELPMIQELFVGNCTSLEKITLSSSDHSLKMPRLEYTTCKKLCEVQNWFRLEPLAKLDVKTLSHFGICNLESMAKVQVKYFDSRHLSILKKPIQGLCEFGIFSTSFPGREVPSLFEHKSMGSSISFSVPSLHNLRIQGLNVCSVYALSNNQGEWVPFPIFAKICNNTKNLKWIYAPMGFGIPEADKDMIWLSHWKFGNQLEAGDEVNVSMVVDDSFQVKECGINLLYDEQEEKEDTQHNNAYPFSTYVIGDKDLSRFEVSTGVHFLFRHRRNVLYDYGFVEELPPKENDPTMPEWYKLFFPDSIEIAEDEQENIAARMA